MLHDLDQPAHQWLAALVVDLLKNAEAGQTTELFFNEEKIVLEVRLVKADIDLPEPESKGLH